LNSRAKPQKPTFKRRHYLVVLGIGIMRLDVGAVLFGMLALLLGIVGLIADRRSRRRLNSRANRET
jgi:hypothetical protein